MFGCSFVQVPSIYCILSAGETARVIWEWTFMSHHLPVLSSGYEKITHRKTMRISQSARVTELLGITPGFEMAPMLLDRLSLIWPLHT